ncbi:unnamed protein product, partial [marine sediment metagenome]
IAGIGGLICFIMLVIEMFKRGQQTMGIVVIITLFCGIGSLIALVIGWMNAKEWNITKLMTIYTACLVGSFVLNGAYYALVLPKMMDQFQNEINNMEMDNGDMEVN